MNRLFIALYLDEDASDLLADLLRARGFDVLTTTEAARKGALDDEQLAFAAREGRALFTHNRTDFEALARRYFEAAESHWGIIIAARHPAHELAARLLVILDRVTADEARDQLIYI